MSAPDRSHCSCFPSRVAWVGQNCMHVKKCPQRECTASLSVIAVEVKTWVGVLRQSTQMELEDRFDWLRQGLVSREGLVPVI